MHPNPAKDRRRYRLGWSRPRHVWLPYCQMKTARAAAGGGARPTAAASSWPTAASWSTASPRGGPPATATTIRTSAQAVQRPARRDAARDVRRPGARAGLTLAAPAGGAAAGGLDRVFFAESGSVAVEVAMKMALQYWLNAASRGRTRFLAFRGGYHGDTLARWRSAIRRRACTRCSRGVLPRALSSRPAAATRRARPRSTGCSPARRRDRRDHRRAAGAGRRRHAVPRRRGAAPAARGWPTGMSCC